MPQTLRASTLDREARAFLRMFNLAARLRPLENYSLREMRQSWRLTALALGRRLPVATVTELQIEGPGGLIALRVFTPHKTAHSLPAFLWCYGGGFIVGDLDTADSICRNIAVAAGCITIAVRYRLAPEHDLAAGREDFLRALEWVAQNGSTLGIDTSRLAIGGDSAGGNISAAVAQETLRRGAPKLRLQVLAYPATDLLQEFPSMAENAEGFLITDQLLSQIKQSVAGSMATLDPAAPWFSPRRKTDLGGLPPALIVSTGYDPIRDDGLDYACKLRAAKVPVELLHYAGQFHGFLNFDTLICASRDALQRIGTALNQAFADEPGHDRTIEIADEIPRANLAAAAVGELATASVTAWTATAGWRDALLRQLSPTLASASLWLLRYCLAPTNLIRRRLAHRLEHLTAHQTYPENPSARS
ncbi:alpha/beta hydrolase [Aquipseudomonas ullengensis]|uniref:Alpha/beta hydrolase n=1 Tax=Aquipseudomonas ullengensis TaxID=2759166 RepID=A0A7W4QFW6_9GAMM|nr:alpha/beta hydrolase [Pseudomonas ullengensis]MBB2497088.1 alpha/beta hydrolase [Pseudomonas ullengensis]